MVGISGVAEVGFNPGALVEEGGLREPALEVAWQVGLVPRGLVGHAAQGGALGLGLDDPGDLALYEEHIIRRPSVALELAYGHS